MTNGALRGVRGALWSWRRVGFGLPGAVLIGAVLSQFGCGGVSPTGNGEPARVVQSTFTLNAHPGLDLLFVIDDAPGSAALQDKLSQRMPDFMDILAALPWVPDLHVGVVSTSFGAGGLTNVPGCEPGTPGDRQGALQHPAACALNPGATYLSVDGDAVNFAGSLGDAASCMVMLGENGCPFRNAFAATTAALTRARDTADPDNGGFLRPDATLGVIVLTSGDDCSVPAGSQFLDPSQTSVGDRLGGLNPYRCAEFGWQCADPASPATAVALPHAAPAVPTSLASCMPKEDGPLTSVTGFVDFLRSLKDDPNKVSFTTIAGWSDSVVVDKATETLSGGAIEDQPALGASCTGGTVTATPAIRLGKAVSDMGERAVFEDACAVAYRPALQIVAGDFVGRYAVGRCIDSRISTVAGGGFDCAVSARTWDSLGAPTDAVIPACDANLSRTPCWQLRPDTVPCWGSYEFHLCYDTACTPGNLPAGDVRATVSCTARL